MSIKKILNKKNNSITFEANIYLPKAAAKKTGRGRITKRFKTEYEAEAWIKRSQSEIELNIFNPNNKLTFQKLTDEFIESCKDKWSYNSFPTFQGFINNYYYPVFKSILLKDFCKFDLVRFKKFLDEKIISDKTKHNICTGLRSILNFAFDRNYFEDRDILYNIPKYKQKTKRSKALNLNQFMELIKIIEIEIIKDIVIFLFYSGLRISELCALRFCDIDFDKKLLSVNNQIIFDKQKYFLKPAKCRIENEPDVIPLNKPAFSILKKYKILKNAGNDEFVFTDFKNNPFRKDGFITFHFEKSVKKLKKMKVINQNDRISLHTLRHSYLTLLAHKGENPKIIQLLARHKDFGFTFNTYVHNQQSYIPESFSKIDADFDSILINS